MEKQGGQAKGGRRKGSLVCDEADRRGGNDGDPRRLRDDGERRRSPEQAMPGRLESVADASTPASGGELA